MTKNILVKDSKSIIYGLISFWVMLTVLSDSMLCSYPIVNNVLWKMILMIRLISVLFSFQSLCNNRVSKDRIISLFVFTIIVVLSYLFSNNWMIFDVFFISIFFGDDLDYKKILKTFMITTLFSLFIVFILNMLKVLPQYEYLNDRIEYSRITLGMHHPNALSIYLMVITVSAFLLYNKTHYRYLVYVLMFLTAIWIAIFPNTLTITLNILLLFVLYFFLKKVIFCKPTIYRKKIIFYLTILITFFFFVFLYFVLLNKTFDTNSIFQKFETLYSRVKLARTGIEKYGITLFGTPYKNTTEIAVHINKTANKYFVIDCLYYLLPIRYGIVGTIAFLYFYFKSIYSAIFSNNVELFSFLITILVIGVSSSYITEFITSFVFICSSCYHKSILKEGSK